MTDTPDTPERQLNTPLVLDRLAANAETLEIPVSFASDRIVEDPWLGPVRLSLEPAAVDLSQAAAKGIPVRIMHQRGLPPARVNAIAIDGGKLRGTMRFSASDLGRSLYRDAVDGILTDLSVGASITAIREEPDHLVAIRWTPREVSIVDEGADPSVGINRAKFSPAAPAAPATPGVIVMTNVAEQTAAPEQTSPATVPHTLAREAANIMELAGYVHGRYPELGVQRLGEEFTQFGRTFAEFQVEAWKLVRERKASEPAVGAPPPAEVGLSPREARQFSIVRASRAYLNRDWKGAEFELSCSRAVAERLGREPKGFFVPLEVQRTMTVADPTAGGYLVGETHRADLFIEALRAKSVAMQAGARSLPGLVGNLSIPKQSAAATFYWLSEGEAVTTSDLTLASVAMTPRTVAGAVPMTRRLLLQSSPAIETLVREDLIIGAALAIDDAVFEGDGVKQPLGIVGTTGCNTQAVGTDGSPTFAEMVGFETEVETDNALAGSLAYVTTPAVRGKLKTTTKDTGSGIMIMGPDGTVNGYPVYVSTQLDTHRIIFGNFADILVGFWGVLDIKPDEATLASSGGLVLRVFQDVDVAVRHGQSFCYGT